MKFKTMFVLLGAVLLGLGWTVVKSEGPTPVSLAPAQQKSSVSDTQPEGPEGLRRTIDKAAKIAETSLASPELSAEAQSALAALETAVQAEKLVYDEAFAATEQARLDLKAAKDRLNAEIMGENAAESVKLLNSEVEKKATGLIATQTILNQKYTVLMEAQDRAVQNIIQNL